MKAPQQECLTVRLKHSAKNRKWSTSPLTAAQARARTGRVTIEEGVRTNHARQAAKQVCLHSHNAAASGARCWNSSTMAHVKRRAYTTSMLQYQHAAAVTCETMKVQVLDQLCTDPLEVSNHLTLPCCRASVS